MKLLLISGHGAGDPGACALGLQEQNLTREAVNMLHAFLTPFCEVTVYPQERNAYVDLCNGKFATGYNFDYMLEVHFNTGGGTGTEILVTSREVGVTCEERMLERLSPQFYINRGIKRRDDLLVINHLKTQGMSTALLETCFLDNPSDMGTWNAEKELIMQNVAEAIIEDWGLRDATPNIPQEPVAPTPPAGGLVEPNLPGDFVVESGKFTCTEDKGIHILKAPSLAGEKTGLFYNYGEFVHYEGYVNREGYIWITWISASTGERRWMAVREIPSMVPYGTFE